MILESLYDTSLIDLLVQKESRQEISGCWRVRAAAHSRELTRAFQTIPLFVGYLKPGLACSLSQ
jgi:hypothetical protein